MPKITPGRVIICLSICLSFLFFFFNAPSCFKFKFDRMHISLSSVSIKIKEAPHVFCDCNIGNFNNQLQAMKLCVAFAASLGRSAYILPACEQDDNHRCMSFEKLVDADILQKLTPTYFLPHGTIRESIPCARPWSGLKWLFNLTLSQVQFATLHHSSSPFFSLRREESICIRPDFVFPNEPNWCNDTPRIFAQLSEATLASVSKYWRLNTCLQSIVHDAQNIIGGSYLSVHIRRSQRWLPNEMKIWSSQKVPDASLSMSTILSIIRFELARSPSLQRRVFVATNSNDEDELSLLESAKDINVTRLAHILEARNLILTSPEIVAIDLELLARGNVFIATPYSTMSSNVWPRTQPKNFCSYRVDLPHLWNSSS